MSASRRRGHQEVWALTPGGVSWEQSSAVTCTCGGLGTSLGGPGDGTVAEPRPPSLRGGGEGPSPEQEEQLWGGERRAAGPCSARAGGTQERTRQRKPVVSRDASACSDSVVQLGLLTSSPNSKTPGSEWQSCSCSGLARKAHQKPARESELGALYVGAWQPPHSTQVCGFWLVGKSPLLRRLLSRPLR